MQILDYDEALKKSGGFGLAQFIICIILVLSFLSKGWIIYGLPYLEKFPNYECKFQNYHPSTWTPCDRDHVCSIDEGLSVSIQNESAEVENGTETEISMGKVLKWRIVEDHPSYIDNWVSPNKLNLTCEEDGVIGLIGSVYFAGFAVSSGIIPPMSDKLGRKWIYIISLTIQTICYSVIIETKSIWRVI